MATRIELLESSRSVSDNSFFQVLGKTFDSAFLEERGYLVSGKTKVEDARPMGAKDEIFYHLTSTQQEFSKSMKSSASGKASFGVAKASAKAEIDEFFSCNSYSCYLIAFARILHPRHVYDLRECEVIPQMSDFIRKNQNDKNNIEKLIGDEIITGVTVASEITVKMEIQTRSEEEKRAIKASAGASGSSMSAKASFSTIANSIKSSKSLKLSVFGDIPNQFMRETSPEEVDKLILEFVSRSKEKYSVVEFSTEPISEIPDLIEYGQIVDLQELSERRRFLIDLDIKYQDNLDWRNDILYAISESNSAEFTEDVKSKAQADWEVCKSHQARLNDIMESASIHWKSSGTNGNMFHNDRLREFPNSFPLYIRKSPTPEPSPSVSPTRASRPARQEHHGGRNSDTGGGPGGIR